MSDFPGKKDIMRKGFDLTKEEIARATLNTYYRDQAVVNNLIECVDKGLFTMTTKETILHVYCDACEHFAEDNEVKLAKAIGKSDLVYDWRKTKSEMIAAILLYENKNTILILLTHLSDFLNQKIQRYLHFLETGTFYMKEK